MKRFLVFVVAFLTRCNYWESMTTATDKIYFDQINGTSQPTAQPYKSAMDQILAANRRRRRNLNKNRLKRMNITGKNDSVDDAILKVNEGQKVVDDLLEGDVALDPMDPEDFELIKLREENKEGLVEKTVRKRQATRQMKRLWHNRQVPYMISNELYGIRDLIKRTIRKFNQMSCVRFVPRRGNEKDYVIFKKNDGCFSRIGRAYTTPGYQTISIGFMCDSEPIILHEMLHAVGFYHEQSRPDRNKFLEILWENIEPQYESQFLQYSHGETDLFGINYNYRSIMHYGKTAFSASGKPTMQSVENSNIELGNTQMSPEDILELDALYDCKTKTYNSWTSWSSFGPCQGTCYKKRQRYCYGRTPYACGGSPNEYGIENEWIKCTADECHARVDGHWGRWSPWGYCSVNCNEGVQVRQRTCDNPKPSNGGAGCGNSEKDYRICRKPRCTLGEDDTDFRNGLLGTVWRNDPNDTPGFDWLVGQGSTATEGTGPSGDHTTGHGYYLFVESSGRAPHDNARLISEQMSPTRPNKKCLKFFYHMFGPTTGSLSVTIYPISRKPKSLFWTSGSQGNEWKPAHVTIDSLLTYQLVFEAVVTNGGHSDIAIDDVFIDEGGCDCQDNYRSCTSWAEKGDCANSYGFMAKYCKRVCNLCGCLDKMKECPKWGTKECKTNPGYMEVNCPLTCRVCACHDNNIRCRIWASKGECRRSRRYMSRNCRKSCGLCT